MPRIPNTNDANGIWHLNEQRNADYGEVWPGTYVPIPAWAGDRYFSYSTFLHINVEYIMILPLDVQE